MTPLTTRITHPRAISANGSVILIVACRIHGQSVHLAPHVATPPLTSAGAGVAAAAFYCGRAYAAQQLAAKDKTGDESIEYPTRGPSDFSFRGEVPVGAESSRGAESSSTIPSLAVTAAVDALADAEAVRARSGRNPQNDVS